MEEPKVMNRWLVAFGAILIQLVLGAIYAWSVFTKPLQESFNFSRAETQWPFSIGLAVFAIVMVIAGRLIGKLGPMKLAMSGGIVLGVGYILAGILGNSAGSASLVSQIVCIGIIGGAGIGLAYVVPIATGIKWFPDKKGLITGLAVAGFGFGAFIWIKLADAVLSFENSDSTGSTIKIALRTGWGGLISKYGIHTTWIIFGVVFAVLVVIGSLFMKNPPAGWLPNGYTPPTTAQASTSGIVDFESGEMLKTPQFYSILFIFIFSAMAGLMVIGIIKLFGCAKLESCGLDTDSAKAIAGTAAVILSLANGLGRIIYGKMSDNIGRKKSIIIMTGFQGVVMFLFYFMGNSEALLYLAAILVGFNFGGNFALFPAITADFFGNKTVGKNYGWVFLAYGFAGIAGPQLAGLFEGSGLKGWMWAFFISGALCILGTIIAIIIKPPQKKTA